MNFKKLSCLPPINEKTVAIFRSQLGMPGNKFKSSKLFPKVAFAGTPLALHRVGYAFFQAPQLCLRAGLALVPSKVAGKSPP